MAPDGFASVALSLAPMALLLSLLGCHIRAAFAHLCLPSSLQTGRSDPQSLLGLQRLESDELGPRAVGHLEGGAIKSETGSHL